MEKLNFSPPKCPVFLVVAPPMARSRQNVIAYLMLDSWIVELHKI